MYFLYILCLICLNWNFGNSLSNEEENGYSRIWWQKEPFLIESRQSRPPNNNANAVGSSPDSSNNGGGAGSLFTRLPQLPPPHTFPFGPIPPNPDTPFDLINTLLVLVPQFKIKQENLPDWFESNVKYSFPITVFFDKLDFPPPPPDPLRPFGLGPIIHFGKYFTPPKNFGKRSVHEGLKKLPHQVIGGERALLLPKINNILTSFGSNTSCLLRFICEVHETPLNEHLGLFGEALTVLFSVSKSHFASTHLPKYLLAEENGKSGDCTGYHCSKSLFKYF